MTDPARQPEPTKTRWTDVLCVKCGGNGVIKIQGGVTTCLRCLGHCYEPEIKEPPPAAEADALARLRQENAEAHERLHDSAPIAVGGKTLTLAERIAELEQTADDALKRNDELEAALARVTAERDELARRLLHATSDITPRRPWRRSRRLRPVRKSGPATR